MQNLTDAQLIAEYAERRSEAAFAELVRRHLDVIYSAARRLVRDDHLAQDIAQGAFVALARNAGQLRNRTVLVGWLHHTARHIASHTIRTDVRRRHREQEAVLMNQLLAASPTDPAWDAIANHLDEALDKLSDADRDAILLRYFEKKTASEIALLLGISEEAAQKRANRAVDRLRDHLSQRGVAVGAAVLIAGVTTQAVHAAPASLAAAIGTTVFSSALTTSATLTATKTIAMTTLQKAAVTAAIIATAGAGIFEFHQSAQLRDQLHALQQQQSPILAQLAELQNQLRDSTNRLARVLAENAQLRATANSDELLKLRDEVTRLRKANTSSDDASQNALAKAWLARATQLKQLATQYPDKSIPEFQLLTDLQWVNLAMDAKWDTDQGVKKAFASLRHEAESDFASQAHDALVEYQKDHNGQFPTSVDELQKYFPSPIDQAILNRWTVAPASVNPDVQFGDPIIAIRAPIDIDTDSAWAIGPNGFGSSSYFAIYNTMLGKAQQAYFQANGGVHFTELPQLEPYLTTPEEKNAYQMLTRMAADLAK